MRQRHLLHEFFTDQEYPLDEIHRMLWVLCPTVALMFVTFAVITAVFPFR